LLGLYFFGLFTKYNIRDKLGPGVVLLSPVLAYLLHIFLINRFEFNMGYMLLLFSGMITFAGLWLIRSHD
jgi:hypothetical protein